MKSPAKIGRDLAALIGLSRKETDLEKLESALVEARAKIQGAIADREDADRDYREAILDAGPAEEERLIAAKGKATVALDKATALEAAIVQRLTSVREAAEQARRQALYDVALAQSEAAQAALRSDYPAAVQQIHRLLRTLSEAELAVAVANASLPEGAAPLVSPELAVRDPYYDRPAVPEPEIIEMWAAYGNHEPLPETDQLRVKRSDPRYDWRGTLKTEDRNLPCERRTFRKTIVLEGPQGSPTNLAAEISLPSLFDDRQPLWKPNKFGFTISSRDPEETLSLLTEVEPLSAAVWRKPAITERIRYEEISRPVETETRPNAELVVHASGRG